MTEKEYAQVIAKNLKRIAYEHEKTQLKKTTQNVKIVVDILRNAWYYNINKGTENKIRTQRRMQK